MDYASAGGLWRRLPRIPGLTAEIGRIPVPSSLPYHLGPYEAVLLATGGLTACVVVAIVAVRLFSWPTWSYVVTDDRIIQQFGLVRHDFQEVPLRQIRDVEIRQDSLWARFLGYGTIHFHSLSPVQADAEAPLPWKLIRDPRLYPSPRSLEPTRWQVRRLSALLRVEPDIVRRGELPLLKRLKSLSGVEWWGGVPHPLRIQREVEEALRRGYGTDKPMPPGEARGSTDGP